MTPEAQEKFKQQFWMRRLWRREVTRYARREQWETLIYGQCPLCAALVRDQDGVPLIERDEWTDSLASWVSLVEGAGIDIRHEPSCLLFGGGAFVEVDE